MPPDHCGKHGQCGTQYSEVTCSGPAYCPGGYCCAQFIVVGVPPQDYRHYTSIACQADCSNTMIEIVVCDPNATDPCPYGGQCVASTLLGTPYNVCN
jgi:hypothetical protein